MKAMGGVLIHYAEKNEEEIRLMGQIITYGERGILNAIVNYLMASGDNNESIERSRNFSRISAGPMAANMNGLIVCKMLMLL